MHFLLSYAAEHSLKQHYQFYEKYQSLNYQSYHHSPSFPINTFSFVLLAFSSISSTAASTVINTLRAISISLRFFTIFNLLSVYNVRSSHGVKDYRRLFRLLSHDRDRAPSSRQGLFPALSLLLQTRS